MAPSGSLVSPERRLHVAEQRARRKLLHDQLETIWDENVRLRSTVLEQKGAEYDSGQHFALAFEHAGRALRKGIGSCCASAGGACLQLVLAHPVTAAPYRCAASALACCVPQQRESVASGASDVTSAAAHAAAQPVLTRRGASTSAPTAAQKRFNLIYVAEDRWEQAVNATVWFPKLTHKQNWDLAILLLILYSCVVVPFRIGMSADAEGYVWLFEVRTPHEYARLSSRQPTSQ